MKLSETFAGALFIVASLAGCGPGVSGSAAPTARFDQFRYEGDDPAHRAFPAGENEFANPILAGFYPDPSIVRVGADFYVVNSTFCYFPGIPVFHSRDLVSWTQIGNVIDREGMLDCAGLGLSRGVFAPTIEHHDGVFYVANTCVDCGGNFIVTSRDPAGPWSDPVWMPTVGGIDPSLYFDDDGKVYLMNNDAPPAAPRYDGHRAIWIREIDPESFQPVTEATVIIDGGVRPEEKPIWIEGPHIYKRDGWYYLSAAEGGTAEGHSQVILRSRRVTGPYEAFAGNPILTQRGLPRERPFPVTSVGHADYVEDDEGRWWAAFLGVRPYEGDYYNTGRETFLAPVEWRDGWPVILDEGATVPYAAPRPALPPAPAPALPTTGRFAVDESFAGETLAPHWISPRAPSRPWLRLANGGVELEARADRLGAGGAPSFIGRRQQHQFAVVTTRLDFAPRQPGDEAGLAAFQSDDFFYALGLGRDEQGRAAVRLRRKAGDGEAVTLASAPVEERKPVRLRIEARGGEYDFSYAQDDDWTMLAAGEDGKVLSTRRAGGFVGALFALYAERAGAN